MNGPPGDGQKQIVPKCGCYFLKVAKNICVYVEKFKFSYGVTGAKN